MNELQKIVSWMNGNLWAVPEDQAIDLLMARVTRIREHLQDEAYKAMLRDKQEAARQKPYEVQGAVAIIPVLGTIIPKADDWFMPGLETPLDLLRKTYSAAERDPEVKAIAFYIDSPGGSVLGVDETAADMFGLAGRKPTGTFYEGLGCSAAYYLGSATGLSYTTPSSIVGSIGVISVHLDYSQYLQRLGITPTVLTYGELKGAGNPYEKLNVTSKDAIQKRINDFGMMFDAAVARNRGVSVAKVKASFGRGTTFVGAEAKSRGLVDGVGTFEEFLQALSGATARNTPAVGRTSAQVAAVEPATIPAATVPQQRSRGMNRKILAALYARNLIDSLEVSDEVAKAALAGFFNGKVPEGDEAILSGLTHAQAYHVTSSLVAEPLRTNDAAQAARDREIAEAREQERSRVLAIQQRGQALGISAEIVNAGIASHRPLGDLLVEWTNTRAAAEPPVSRDVRVTEQGANQFAADASAALQLRMRCNVPTAAVNADAQRLSRAPLSALALQCLQMRGERVEDPFDREAVCRQAFGMDGGDRQTIRADSGPVNRPGSFPNLLSNLANKLLDDAIDRAETTYQLWTGMWPDDLPDFKPAPVINKSRHAELDEMLDAEAFKEFGLSEEVLSHMQLSRYGNKFGLTPVMAANDDLGAFREETLGMGEAVEITTNRLCLALITGNVTLLDGYGLFDDSNHLNVITSGGGAPSVTTWDLMQQKMALQRDVGNKAYIRARLAVALVPPALNLASQQTFYPLAALGELKNPTTDATINPNRGKVQVAVEPELAASSSAIWYGMADPAYRATVVRAYFRGFGKAGKRERWYDPNTGVWWFSVEHRVGACAKNYRYAVRNPGS